MLCGRRQMLWNLSRSCERRSAGGWWIKKPLIVWTVRASSPGFCADIIAGTVGVSGTIGSAVHNVSVFQMCIYIYSTCVLKKTFFNNMYRQHLYQLFLYSRLLHGNRWTVELLDKLCYFEYALKWVNVSLVHFIINFCSETFISVALV